MSDFITRIKVRGEEYDIRDAEAARIDSPEFTGIPLAPTADADTDSPQIATTAFVQRAVKDKFGKPGGIAILDENGKVPTSQLPSYVDDVLEGIYDEENNQFLDTNGNVYTPESDKIYVDINTNTTYRWSGTLYIKIGGGSDEVPDGVVYIDPDEASSDLPDIDAVTSAKYVSYNNVNSGIEGTNVQEAIDETSAIAKGRNRARVFNTTDDMNAWLSDEVNKGTAIVGDNLYIVALDVPDWWISEVLEEADADTGFFYKIAQLETQKVDLTTIESSISSLTDKTVGLESDVSYISSKTVNITKTYSTTDNYITIKFGLSHHDKGCLILRGVHNSGGAIFATLHFAGAGVSLNNLNNNNALTILKTSYNLDDPNEAVYTVVLDGLVKYSILDIEACSNVINLTCTNGNLLG